MNKGIINIFDHISSFGISSKTILNTLEDFKSKNISEIEVRINSAGGSLFEGFSIFNQLRDFGNVTTIIDGIAASIASVIALAGNKILAYKNSYIFIHNPWNIAIGDTNDFQDQSNNLGKFRDTLIDIYKAKTNLDEEKLKEMCNKSSFISADEALAIGLIDEIIDNYRTEKFVAFSTAILDETGNPLPEQSKNNNASNDKSSANDLLSVVTNLKNDFTNLKDDLTKQLNYSVQLKIDISKFEFSLNDKIKSGSLTPAIKLSIMDLLQFITSEHVSNSENQTKTLLSKFDALLDQFPNMLLLDDFAKNLGSSKSEYEYDNYEVDPESFSLHKKVLALSKEQKISYKDALLSLMNN
ncbi:MAG: ATP-dependent Clp protease proteolytic subunit [Ignavibacteriae bacterium]|nr:ATP-dependent Clp protease proteolytic subunit [Ignavibacteriota bacterium]